MLAHPWNIIGTTRHGASELVKFRGQNYFLGLDKLQEDLNDVDIK